MFGAWAAHEKYTWYNFNCEALERRTAIGMGGLFEGQFAAKQPFTRTFQGVDPGRRPEA